MRRRHTGVLLLALVLAVHAIEEEGEVLPVRQITFPGASQGRPQGGRGQGGGGCTCQPIITCASELRQLHRHRRARGDERIFRAGRKNVNMGPLDPNMVNAACQIGANAVNQIRNIENNLARNNIALQSGTRAEGHLRVFDISRSARQMHTNALAIVMASMNASMNMMQDFKLSKDQGGHGLRNLNVRSRVLSEMCPPNPDCRGINQKYRTADGSCNNQANPVWGKSNTPVQRILPPTYNDGVSVPRVNGVNGSPLPNVRALSGTVLVDVDNPDPQFTSSVMQWAQFLDHDFAHVPFPDMVNNEGIECCQNGQELTGPARHPACWPINTAGDAFYGPRARSCMNFIRSMVAIGPECRFGYAVQLNQLTHWIAGSNVYGSDIEEQTKVRDTRDGLLKTSGNNMLPFEESRGANCLGRERGVRCFTAGDSPVNEQPGLTAIHTIWMREHNRVARQLKALNPSWNDETVFQEGRRFVVAEMQHITYNVWLPIIVGPAFMESFAINVRTNGYSFDYNPNYNPNMNNEFATSAYRFGHTLVNGNLRIFGPDGSVSTIQLRDHFRSPHFIQQPAMLDAITRSFLQLPIQKFDSFNTQDLSNHLFQTPRVNFGMDQMSLNIHRGRVHAIATYNDMRLICGLRRALSFDDLTDQIPGGIVQNLCRVSQHVDDIDFFVGGTSERPVSGGILGWTFLCVVGVQFARLKMGDRYFYDLGGKGDSFSPQLQEIRRGSWARIICGNWDNIQAVQPLALPAERKPVSACRLPRANNPNTHPSIVARRARGLVSLLLLHDLYVILLVLDS
uniref:Peroxinectin n=1 Tax=Scylla serrata TaxID=6761 RepID=C6ETD3_SCYSE|nr:peroxinectin [Scylla serrata]